MRMIVTVDPWMTPTAMASDIILPGTTPFEEDDLTTGGTAWTGFICCESKAIEPLFEAKPVYEICTLLADALGIKDEFTEGKTQLDWVEWCYNEGKVAGDDLPDTFEEFRAVRPHQADRRPRAGHRRAGRPARHALGQVRGVLEAGLQPVAPVGPHRRRVRARRRPRPDHGPAHLVRELRGLRRPAARGVSLPAHRPPHQDAHPLLLRQRAVDELGGPAAVLDQRGRRRHARHQAGRHRHRVHRARPLSDDGEGDEPHHARRGQRAPGRLVRPGDPRRRYHRRPQRARFGRLHLGADVLAPDADLQGQRRPSPTCARSRRPEGDRSWNSTDFSSTPTSAPAARPA